ncbi:hypothetical protein KL935_001171 [Ogataea polymorpha]|uniref:uncharacterized protein n=1 Tax=Ogataea polymorpha TaxID=460523 RepID=UPI0007F4B186|nr:uncharacterized protein OGAPODRAFT_47550 [Ogataea polymorpha]KAG7882014.1 hypothetical protein KL937_000585 [Ogataea polymorpha]KAG7895255.1 hypothetical protein KL908_001605 [Ogataea polymorpha]KAG7902263.1 hypothetical protein KL935_001171 [Ogataea polymorpha]KAG7911749.1 hypothetical protein KL906_001070 [Ogataea polymorpha]KAG7912415.1 hypothetical protein KL907_000617 [Ogataea polymorpha]
MVSPSTQHQNLVSTAIQQHTQDQSQAQRQAEHQAAQQVAATTQSYRPLNVKDALSYLDQVKIQFQNQTDVYNNFLDIMKDFKSQNIDTPGVIERVSTLFRGHPKLIDGFNTFLPQGFAIECSSADPNTIIVTTPMGKTVRQDPGPVPYDPQNQHPAAQLEYQYPQQSQSQYHQMLGNVGQQPPYYQAQQQPPSQPLHQQEVKQGSPAEFDQAINYVNKIKQRYANEPDIYKHFLENLQMYQKGIKPIDEVYREISVLFRDAPDLLEDFKLFMPDTTAPVVDQQGRMQGPQLGEYNNYGQVYYDGKQAGHLGQPHSQAQPQQSNVQLPPVGSFQPPTFRQPVPQMPSKDKKKKWGSQQLSQPIPSQKSYQMTQPYDEPPVSNIRASLQPRRKDENPSLLPGVPEPVYPNAVESDLTDEVTFFDKVKKAINNKQTYNEFLKFLRLYTSEVIDKDTLVEKAEGFIGGFPDLFDWFKSFVGWEEKPLHIENIAIKKQQLDLMMCKACGPSYRLLPKSQTYMPCSGRDEMCWEVLNDEWAGHPVWASEESGFIAHRKNQYEDILFRIEEERHEYDFYMEANLRTIQTLETIANRLANMTPDEKAKFKLPPGLGHTSVTIYKKVIRKVYDKDKGFEVIEALHENPAVAVPVVLKRLKQKDEEWKRAHREWNKVWRELEQKAFYKSLDHLGLTFKQIDKKLLTNKQLVSEISTIKQEQLQKKLHPLMPIPAPQLSYHYDDFEVFMDILKLVDCYLSHNQTYSQYDKEKIEGFLRSFIAKFFFLDSKFIDNAMARRSVGQVKEVQKEDPDNKETVPAVPTLSQSKKRSRENDLLRDVLKKVKKPKKNEGDEESDSAGSAQTASQGEENDEVERAQTNWITNDRPNISYGDDRTEFNMFCNTQLYVFYRFLNTLYERLLEIKKMAPSVNKEIKSRKVTPFAKDLGLINDQLEEMGINIKGDDSYNEALELCAKVIEGSLDQNNFEETLRQGFRNKAFKLFTVDKVISGLLKHCHNIVSDSKCTEIVLLMEKDRNNSKTTARDQIIYRMQVRNLMASDENMFKIVFNKAANDTTITFLALDDTTIRDDSKTPEEKWNYYLTSYAMSHPTEGIDPNAILLPFLKSNVEEEEEEEDEIDGIADSKLKVKIDKETYRLVFEPGSYDVFVRDTAFSKDEKRLSKEVRMKSLQEALDGEFGLGKELDEGEIEEANKQFRAWIEQGPQAFQQAGSKLNDSAGDTVSTGRDTVVSAGAPSQTDHTSADTNNDGE